MNDILKTYRRDLHQIPELAFDLFKTHEYLKKELIRMGYEPIVMAKTGLVISKKGLSSEAILFRTDMDGLPVHENLDVSFQSTHKGNMHACGHDGHMAMMLSFASYCSTLSNLKKTIVMIFQPAEEGPGGASVMIEEGLFEMFHITACYGIHLYPGLEEGLYGLTPGPMMAQNAEFDISITGKSAHGGQPHQGIDAIVAAAHLVSSYQSIVSRRVNPLEKVVLSIGTIHGGEARNIIAQEVRLSGTLRAFNQDLYHDVKTWMRQIDQGIETQYQVKIINHIKDYYPPVINDIGLFNNLKDSLKPSSYKVIEPMTVSEDFAFYQQKVPGIFVMLGTKNEILGYVHPLHSCYFNFDECVLEKGVLLYQNILKLHQVI